MRRYRNGEVFEEEDFYNEVYKSWLERALSPMSMEISYTYKHPNDIQPQMERVYSSLCPRCKPSYAEWLDHAFEDESTAVQCQYPPMMLFMQVCILTGVCISDIHLPIITQGTELKALDLRDWVRTAYFGYPTVAIDQAVSEMALEKGVQILKISKVQSVVACATLMKAYRDKPYGPESGAEMIEWVQNTMSTYTLVRYIWCYTGQM